jgi:hypothetical protein
MSRRVLVTALVALIVPAAAFAQQQQRPQVDPQYEMMRRQAQMSDRQERERDHDLARGTYGWSKDYEAKLEKLRAGLAQSWRDMGMSPEGAKLVADAYDPKLAAKAPKVPIRGKSDQEVAQMMQAALKGKRYLEADQLLIDYQQRKVELNGAKTADGGN